MLFFIYCVDKPGSADIRAANRPDHLAHLEKFRDNVVMVGPTLTDAGDGMDGSVLLMDFPDRAAAEAFCAEDPYARAGLFDSVTIKRWKKVLPPE